ncbi:hypothetical protein [Nocardia rosealba]|uniref:hypothetical protein n=1 Tax=Nocardia rosealba TaxID=2878563 RepID=UPI001CDA380E|nr:hypothetical protein [Nocardia rosealba]MCA2207850.1 hypothetical protein [Nocardia rosealba]
MGSPVQREFDISNGPERPVPTDDFGLEQVDDRLGECVAAGIANAADRGRHSLQGKGFSEQDRGVSTAVDGTVQPTIDLENTSKTNATYAHSVQVEL